MKDSSPKEDHYLEFSIEMLENIAKSANLEAQFEGQPQSMRRLWWNLELAAFALVKKLQGLPSE